MHSSKFSTASTALHFAVVRNFRTTRGRDSMGRPPTTRLVRLFAGNGALEFVTTLSLPVVTPTDTDTEGS